MMQCHKMNVQGKVQGVFFRKHTQLMAIKYGIKGWVKNETDGSVSIEAVGEEEAIKNFIAWCHKGPENANVSHVTSFKVDKIPQWVSFEIVR